MTEKNISTIEEEKKEKAKQPKRKKATTGAWWKSTTIVDDTIARPSDSQTSLKSEGAATSDSAAPLKDTAAAEKKGRKRSSRKKQSSAQNNDAANFVVTENAGSAQSDVPAPAIETAMEGTAEQMPAQGEQAKSRRKRGRPRKKPAEKNRVAEQTEPASADKSQPSVELPEEVATVPEERVAEERQKTKPSGRKRPQRKKKTPTSRAGSLNIEEELPGKVLSAEAERTETTVKALQEDEDSGTTGHGGEQDIGAVSDLEDTLRDLMLETEGKAGVLVKTAIDEAGQVDSEVSVEIEELPEPTEKKARVAVKEPRKEKLPDESKEAPKERRPVIKLLINAEEPEECRLALLEDGRLESIHVATSTRTQTKNNIYKAKIVAIEPNLQAAFVDYGTEKNGFLPFSEIHPEYYKENVSDKVQKLIDQHQWKKLSITDVVEKGREVLVQVVKEEVGKKGANMTTYLSLPGRCVVLMPGSDSTGISRKISGEERRALLREHLLSMNIPEGIGWIVRTASLDITKAALQRDVSYLIKLWDEVKKKGQELDGVGLIYQDHDHVLRFLREHFDPDIQEILVDNEDALEQVRSFVELLPAKQRKVRCKLHRGARPIFNQYSIEDQIESIYQPKVNLPSGGSIVIDPTEALVAIDVNSGSTGKGKNFEETIFQANMEAAHELARQLRLRDLGGLIVVDFIDMRSKKNIREVEREVKTAMKRDKAKVDISRISKFGLMQISRQKLGAPIEAGNYRICSHCKGRGIVRSVETLALYYLRRIHTAASRKMVRQIECRFPLDVAQYLLNNKRQELRDLENRHTTEVVIVADPSFRPADNEIIFHKADKDEPGKRDRGAKNH